MVLLAVTVTFDEGGIERSVHHCLRPVALIKVILLVRCTNDCELRLMRADKVAFKESRADDASVEPAALEVSHTV
jgi:hypothetical protein